MRIARMAAAATAISLVGAATLVSPAHAATPGVGTSATSSSLLDVALGTSGSLLNLKVLADEARSTIDPTVSSAREAYSRLNALSLTSSVLPAPLNNISLPMVESKTPGGNGAVAGPSLNLAQPTAGLNLPLSLLGGAITPANLTSAVDAEVPVRPSPRRWATSASSAVSSRPRALTRPSAPTPSLRRPMADARSRSAPSTCWTSAPCSTASASR